MHSPPPKKKVPRKDNYSLIKVLMKSKSQDLALGSRQSWP